MDYVRKFIEASRDRRVGELSAQMQEGMHVLYFADARDFAEGEAFLNDKPIRRIEVEGSANAELVIGSVTSIYEVETRGRLLVVRAESGGIQLRAQIVETLAGS